MTWRDYWIVTSDTFVELLQCAFGLRRKCTNTARLDGKVAIITGANAGIGKETALQMSMRGARIIMGCRDLNKTDIAINDIKTRNPSANIYGIKLDLASLQSVRQFAREVTEREDKIDILVLNAGVPLGPEQQTQEGFEMQFGVHHLANFLLTLHLLPVMKKSSDARIITVSTLQGWGRIHFENINLRNGAYGQMKAHMQSKLANLLFTRELAARLGPKSTVKSYAINPSAVNSRPAGNIIGDFFKKLLTLPIEMGPATIMYCALEESLANESGHYYNNCRRIDRMVSGAVDDESAKKLWELSVDLVKLEEHLKI